MSSFPQHFVLPFSQRLEAAVRRCGTPVMVGLDPRLESLPQGLRPATGAPSETIAQAYAAFCRAVIDVVAPMVPAVKPQAAFFEQLGPAGMAALAQVIYHARQKGLVVIIDGKRGDIGSTAEAYARGYLGPTGADQASADASAEAALTEAQSLDDSQSAQHAGSLSAWGGDALTVNPYLGGDSLQPFVDAAVQRGAGVFVLVRTSNPGARMFQDLICDGKPLYRHVAEYVESLAAATASANGYGAVGAVVGATYPEELAQLRDVIAHAWLLVPGYGSQGATARDVAAAFDAQGLGAIVNNSRGIIFAYTLAQYRERFGHSRWQQAVEAATRDMIDRLRAETPAGRLVE